MCKPCFGLSATEMRAAVLQRRNMYFWCPRCVASGDSVLDRKSIEGIIDTKINELTAFFEVELSKLSTQVNNLKDSNIDLVRLLSPAKLSGQLIEENVSNRDSVVAVVTDSLVDGMSTEGVAASLPDLKMEKLLNVLHVLGGVAAVASESNHGKSMTSDGVTRPVKDKISSGIHVSTNQIRKKSNMSPIMGMGKSSAL
ncbi:hypothetical protein WA026_022781 [Henosepilachna vigintioctopunctata]|uniref:Uncharacterized protein n=1 Tax=Henosepilachna vigintioctopunctata TaxID=420089 RepID=A0AAW1VB50_9CUCU